MKKLLILLLLLSASSHAVTLADFRWHAMTLADLNVSRTSLVSNAQVDSFVVNADKTVATDFALSAYMTNTDVDTIVAVSGQQLYSMDSSVFIPGGLLSVLRKPSGEGGFYKILTSSPRPAVIIPGDSFSVLTSSVDTQTVTTTQTDPTDRTQVYTMNNNFVLGGLLSVMRKPKGAEGYYKITAGPPDPVVAIPDNVNDPAYAWTEGNLLFIQPAPRVADKFLLTYRCLPTAMSVGDPAYAWTEGNWLFIQPAPSAADSFILSYRSLPTVMADSAKSTGLDPALHRMIIVLAAADIKKKLGLIEEEMALRAEYSAFKQERLILPKAQLEGASQ